jgi:hypothetical protein
VGCHWCNDFKDAKRKRETEMKPVSSGYTDINKIRPYREIHGEGEPPVLTGVGMWTYPLAMREAATGIFLWAAWGLYDSIKGDKFKHINLSHD